METDRYAGACRPHAVWNSLCRIQPLSCVPEQAGPACLRLDDGIDDLPGGLRCQCTPDIARRFEQVGPHALQLTGYSPDDLRSGKPGGLQALIHPLDRDAVDAVILDALKFAGTYRMEYRIVCADGREKWVAEQGQCRRVASRVHCFDLVLRDIDSQVASAERYTEMESRYRSLFENSVVGIFQTSTDGKCIMTNQALADLYRYPSPQAFIESTKDIPNGLYVSPDARKTFFRLMHENGRVLDWESEVRRADGSTIWISESAWPVRDSSGTITSFEGMVRDITPLREHHALLRFQATHDLLTSLPNRQQLPDIFDSASRLALRQNRKVALSFLDIDNFKVINDSLGHENGDRLLQRIAKRLASSIGKDDSVVRYGGDEFVVISVFSGENQQIESILCNVLTAVQRPITLSGHSLHINCSIGVVLFPDETDDLSGMLRHADVAMYQAKARGKGVYHFYTRELNRAANARFSMEIELHQALELGQIDVHFQPKVDVDGRISGCEALARWNHPSRGMIGPDQFIPVAEETGLILPLGWEVLHRACLEAQRWPLCNDHLISIAVNISARQLKSPDLLDEIRRALDLSGLPPDRLELEITESMLMDNIESTISVLGRIRSLGVRIAIDDFGTGYSSLAYLKRLPVDTLKIDRSFVRDCENGGDAMIIPRAVIFLGKNLDLKIVAEGIEHPGQVKILAEKGCDEFQGYLIARPMDKDRIHGFLAGHMMNPVSFNPVVSASIHPSGPPASI